MIQRHAGLPSSARFSLLTAPAVIDAASLLAGCDASQASEDPRHQPALLSAGLVQAEPEDTIDQVVERADKTMYQAKASGRNRSVSAPVLTPSLFGNPVPPPAFPA